MTENNLKNKKYIFAGNRSFVYERMVQLELNIKNIYAVKNSYLERHLIDNSHPYKIIEDKKSFISQLYEDDFDFLITNGLPVILPISLLKENSQKNFINIHPSLLPDLRGADPVPGALLFNRKGGATCHFMDDQIDHGPVISQVLIDNTPDLSAGLLYQLSFIAERQVFDSAFLKNFTPSETNISLENCIYYSFKENDLEINWSDSIFNIINKVKAFSTKSKGAFFTYKNYKIKVLSAEIIINSFANSLKNKYKNLEVIFSYENTLVIKKDDVLLKFLCFDPTSNIKNGVLLNEMA